MKREYDSEVTEHYKKVAKQHGLLSTSTMADEITRDLETKAIVKFVDESLNRLQIQGLDEPAIIMDVGCGNGYTLEYLSNLYPNHKFVGIEKSDDLRALATSRFNSNSNVKIYEGDIRNKDFSKEITPDILICQRVLINILEVEDQKDSLHNLIDSVSLNGTFLFIEGFTSSLEQLNEAREEFDLTSIPPAYLNLFLSDSFFEVSHLEPFTIADSETASNFLSTHYYVTRVLHEILTPQDKPFKRNSEFVKFFTKGLNQNVGDYSPLKLFMFQKSK